MIILMTALLLGLAPTAKTLTADLLVTNQPGTVLLRWQQGAKLEISNVKTARRGEPVGAFVLFSGCAPDKRGNCDVRMHMAVLDPTGKVYGESKDAEIWTGKAAPTPGSTQMGVDYLVVRIEPKDPAGRYVVKAHVTDGNHWGIPCQLSLVSSQAR